jgi:predicted AAA+ superfamily ATPase
MISRTLQKDVIRYLSLFPVVAILGARQVGKTTKLAEFMAQRRLSRKLSGCI